MSHYLDFAATAALRPPEVVEAVARYLTECGATPGRGGHALALEAGRTALRTRRAVLEVLGLGGGDASRVVFTSNATHGINLGLRGILAPGDAVVVTELDHNAVLRPVHGLARERGLEVRRVPADADGRLDMEAFREAVRGARLVTLNAGSNVLGTVLPVPELAGVARKAGALTLVDAAQTAGHVAMDLSGVDLVAVTGHKALLGPQGIGALWVRPGLEVEPLLRGGTGGDSMDPEMPRELPDRLEAGTLNGPGIAGLEAGCRWVLERGIEALHRRSSELKARLYEGLSAVSGLRVLSPPAPEGTGIVTVVPDDGNPARLGRLLERDHGVLARAGLHCAPGVHRILGTTATGALRLSLGWASSEEDVDGAVEGAARVLASPASPVP